jgi:RNA polymerase sigma-70 factor (ECF subfamily)
LHAPRVRRLAYRLLGWHGDVDDVVQDVFLAALTSIKRFRRDASIATWLSAITINRCRAHRRKRLLQLRWFQRGVRFDDEPPADQTSLNDETSARVRHAVRALRLKDREVIVLYYLEKLSAANIATLLRISRGAVEVRLHRARGRLRESLAEFMKD